MDMQIQKPHRMMRGVIILCNVITLHNIAPKIFNEKQKVSCKTYDRTYARINMKLNTPRVIADAASPRLAAAEITLQCAIESLATTGVLKQACQYQTCPAVFQKF